jgi:LPS sulfotransferase NodH
LPTSPGSPRLYESCAAGDGFAWLALSRASHEFAGILELPYAISGCTLLMSVLCRYRHQGGDHEIFRSRRARGLSEWVEATHRQGRPPLEDATDVAILRLTDYAQGRANTDKWYSSRRLQVVDLCKAGERSTV